MTDETDHESVTLAHETKHKNFKGGLSSEKAKYDIRMNATGDNNYPVEMLGFLSRRPKGCCVVKHQTNKSRRPRLRQNALFNSSYPNVIGVLKVLVIGSMTNSSSKEPL